MTDNDAVKRKELRELLATATPGPWRYAEERFGEGLVLDKLDQVLASGGTRDVQRLVAAFNALPALLDALDTADARVAVLEEELVKRLPLPPVDQDALVARLRRLSLRLHTPDDLTVFEAAAEIERLRLHLGATEGQR